MKTINGVKWYRPREVAEQGLITSSLGDDGTVPGHYNFILDAIKHGKLKAKNYGHGKVPYYLISEEEINRYNGSH